MIEWREIPISSNVAALGYSDDPPALLVRWVKGRVSMYLGVPRNMFEEGVRAPSVGSWLNQFVKGHYDHQYVNL